MSQCRLHLTLTTPINSLDTKRSVKAFRRKVRTRNITWTHETMFNKCNTNTTITRSETRVLRVHQPAEAHYRRRERWHSSALPGSSCWLPVLELSLSAVKTQTSCLLDVEWSQLTVPASSPHHRPVTTPLISGVICRPCPVRRPAAAFLFRTQSTRQLIAWWRRRSRRSLVALKFKGGTMPVIGQEASNPSNHWNPHCS